MIQAPTRQVAAPVVTLSDVEAGYPGVPPVVRGVSLTFDTGLTLLIGPNGAGKSTLLKALAGLVRVTSGTIVLGEREVQNVAPWDLHSAGVALVPQGRCNFPRMRVIENLELATHRMPRSEARSAVQAALERFPVLEQKRREFAGNLSGGQQQVLEMAMVLQTSPRVLLLDEPSLGLSPRMQDEVFGIVRAVVDGGTPVIMVEQNVARAARWCDRVVVLVNGRLRMEMAGSELAAGRLQLREAFLGTEEDR